MDSVTDFDRIDFSSLNEDETTALCQKLNIQLTKAELTKIQFEILKRPPTLAECLLWSIEGSEHCSYKSSKQHLKKLPTDGKNLLLGIGEDAGIVKIATDNKGENFGIAISHESHNHPSQIVPFEGAATGVGGNVRDISCMGAEVIAVADSLRFGEANHPHTQWLKQGVVSGIASYGNALGLPNVAGDCYYHPDYQSNCLVTVVSLGLIREKDIIHSHTPKDSQHHQLILVGKPTDNSGFGGASFASSDLNEGTANRGAVQEPNAFLERHLLKANEALFKKLSKENLISHVGFKDLGAGGIACAAVELAASSNLGATLQLEKVHCSLKDLAPSVILCAETQERFMWSVPQSLVSMVLAHYNETFDLPNVSNGARASLIGEITKEPQFIVKHSGTTLVDAPALSVTEGLEVNRAFSARERQTPCPPSIKEHDLNAVLTTLAHQPNLSNHKAIYEHYDKQVQGRTKLERGRGPAGVLSPFNSDDYPKELSDVGVALSVSHNPFVSRCCPKLGAEVSVMQALEKVVSVGASPQAITDCLCFGNPENPHHMYDFTQAIEGISALSQAYSLFEDPSQHLPVAAGNVSFYNQTNGKAIPASPIISCLGRLEKASLTIDSSLKETDSELFMLSGDYLSLAGSQFQEAFYPTETFALPKLDKESFTKRLHFMIASINEGLLLSSRPIHEGGLLFNVMKMGLAKGIGANLEIFEETSLIESFCCERLGFIVEVNQSHATRFLALAKESNLTPTRLGQTTAKPFITIPKQNPIDLKTFLED